MNSKMISVNATWEKRNLGVDTIETTFEENDEYQTVELYLCKLKTEYSVLRIPSYRTDLLPIVQKMGYTYIEDMIYAMNYLNEIPRTSSQERLYKAIEVDTMNEKDFEILYQEINKGIFDSDRIYTDPYFNHDIAKKRYINWILDELKTGTEFLKYIYKNDTIGFFALKELENGCYTSFLGGIYKEYRKGGIGSVIKVPEEVKKRGGKKVSSNVSSNNIMQVKSLIMNGYRPESITHTFIKHFN